MFLQEPTAEVEINLSIVRQLIDNQFPELMDQTISFLDSGWDNENYRLGSEYIIRLPRRSAAIPLLQNEITWLPKLKNTLPINIPSPIHIGRPSELYPWQWSVIPWYDGVNGCISQLNDDQVIVLADFFKALHAHQPADTPYNDHRCLPLSDKSEAVMGRIMKLTGTTDLVDDQILELWHQAVKESGPTKYALIHGDMHPRNIIINDGRLEAVIDWGDITSGDVAPDIASLWMLFNNPEIRVRGFKHYGADQSLINRSRGWAIFFGTLFLELGDSASNEYKTAGMRILKNVLYK